MMEWTFHYRNLKTTPILYLQNLDMSQNECPYHTSKPLQGQPPFANAFPPCCYLASFFGHLYTSC